MSIPGLQDKESQISDPWSSLFKLLVLIGQNLGWDIEIEFFTKTRYCKYSKISNTKKETGWLGWVMVLGSFQCWGILLLLHIVGQGPAVLAAGMGWVAIFFIFFINLPFLMSMSFGRQLNMTEILWFRLLNPNSNCQLLLRTSSLSTG